ncbi:DMT family transporter [uncultured Schumannella sp.]|uniref:DMT family transporter n=1 Tax=uncultured Schumannella sp. TaxID=1195956 RepID=UPI0025D5434A|nr:EamA family transporter [uncultured Schumannella sp.]
MNPGAVLALVLASALWGTTGTAASFFPDDVSPIAVGSATMGIGGIVLFALAGRRAVSVLRSRVPRRWVALGALGVVVYPLAFYSGMDLAGVAVGNVVALGSGPVFSALLEWLLERRPLSRRWLIATALAVVGIAALATSRALFGDTESGEGRAGDAPFAGIAVALVAGLAYALYTYASGRAIAAGGTSRGVMAAMFGLGGVALVPVLAATGAPLLQSPDTVGIAGYLVLGPMVLAYLLFGIGVRELRSSHVTTITLLEPVVATLLAVVVVGERLAPLGWGGVALILLGLSVLVSARRTPFVSERI